MTDDLRQEVRDGVAWLHLDRPEKRNAINFDMWSALPDVVAEVDDDQDVRVMVIRGGDDRTFSAGADISEFESLRSTEDGARRYNAATERAETALRGMTKPTIAMVQGPCIGGGCGLAINCDLRLCDPQARFAITPAKLGLVYSLASTRALVDLVGPSQAKYILFTGLQFDAPRALRIGLVDDVHPADELEHVVAELAATIASRAQYSVRGAKRIVNLVTEGNTQETEESRELRSRSFASEDYREGVRAFLEKRPPDFAWS